MKSANDVMMQLMERNDAAADYEDLIAEIKSTLESPFYSDALKLKYIRQSYEDYDL